MKCSVIEKVNVVKTKTASPSKARVKTFVPKPKQKVVKTVYQGKCTFVNKVDIVKIKNVVLPDKC